MSLTTKAPKRDTLTGLWQCLLYSFAIYSVDRMILTLSYGKGKFCREVEGQISRGGKREEKKKTERERKKKYILGTFRCGT
jgi:hypothetical protein